MILVINAGSSNTKFAIYDPSNLQQIYRGQVDSIQHVFAWIQSDGQQYKITSVGHRIVHGGTKFSEPILITENVVEELKKLIPLAPLHEPHNIAAIEYIMQKFPDLPQVGCFDTAFHRTDSVLAQHFAIPRALTDEGIIRYGFHGLSYEYIASVLEDHIGVIAKGKVIVAHLGNGSSMCAMDNKLGRATTMGFSALDGLMMGTRCGSIDPGVLLYLMQEKKYDVERIAKFLYNECGLLGVSGVSNDMRELTQSNAQSAQQAVDLYCYKAACELGKLVVDLQGCDAVIFTAGIGENSSVVRQKICTWLEWLGVRIDIKENNKHAKLISTADSKLVVTVIPTDEELVIARHVLRII